jgi:Leucine-rich repeat (LRR) protein
MKQVIFLTTIDSQVAVDSQSTELELYGKRITDIASLRDLQNVGLLDLINNQLTDMSDLSGGDLPKLKSLQVGGNLFSSVKCLSSFTTLTRILLTTICKI